MGRIIFADDRVVKQIESLYTKNQWNIGLIIGHFSNQRNFAVHLACTPSPDELSTDGGNDEASSKNKQKKNSKNTTTTLDTIDESWVANHANQVVRMIPGGLDIIGIFAVAPPDMMKSSQQKLRQVLYAVQKSLTRICVNEPGMKTYTDKVILNICSSSRKLTCRVYDVSDHKSTASPGEWKTQHFLDRWTVLDGQTVFDSYIEVSNQASNQSLFKQINAGLSQTWNSIKSSLITFNGQLLSDENQLCHDDKPTGKKKSSKGNADNSSSQSFNVNVFLQTSQSLPEPIITDCSAKMLLRGTIKIKAYLPNKATVKEAKDAVKTDIMRSLASRCILLCEDVETTEEDQDPKILYETPQRILGSLKGTPIKFCDYVFSEETPSDALERFTDLLDLSLTSEDLEMDIEPLPEEEDLVKAEYKSEEEDVIKDKQILSNGSKVGFDLIGLGIGGAVAAVSAALAYVYFGQD